MDTYRINVLRPPFIDESSFGLYAIAILRRSSCSLFRPMFLTFPDDFVEMAIDTKTTIQMSCVCFSPAVLVCLCQKELKWWKPIETTTETVLFLCFHSVWFSFHPYSRQRNTKDFYPAKKQITYMNKTDLFAKKPESNGKNVKASKTRTKKPGVWRVYCRRSMVRRIFPCGEQYWIEAESMVKCWQNKRAQHDIH